MIDAFVTVEALFVWSLIGLACVCASATPIVVFGQWSDTVKVLYTLLVWATCLAVALLALVNG